LKIGGRFIVFSSFENMKPNVGLIDKIIRGLIGLGLIYVASLTYAGHLILSIIVFVLALVAIITSFTGFCLFYKIFGIDTNKSQKNSSQTGESR